MANERAASCDIKFYNLILLEFDEGLNAGAAQHENKPVF